VSEKLNLLYISNLYPPYLIGGAEIMVSYLAEFVAGQGHRITVVSTEGPSDATNDGLNHLFQNGVEVIRFFPKNQYWIYNKGNPSLVQKAVWHFRDAWNTQAAQIVGRIISQVKPDLIHTHNIDSFSPAVWQETKKQGIPLVHTTHDCHLICPRATLLKRNGEVCSDARLACKFYRKWYVKKSSLIDILCAPSQLLLDLHKSLGIMAGQFRLVRNGIPDVGFGSNSSANYNDNNLNILYMGRIDVHKGILILLEAFQRLPKDVPVILNIAGAGPLEADVIKAAQLDSRIKFYGFVSGNLKRKLFTTSDLFLLPTICNDNAPITILEAYQSGLVVLASDIGGLPELVDHNKTGLLFPPGDTEALQKILLELATDFSRMQKFRPWIEAIRESYTVSRMAQEYMNIYQELLG
jgi:glycosyltransferase involved in cell wall biosynthesis